MTALQGQSGAGMVPMHISKSRAAANADMNGKRVSRGCVVSWHGLRYVVTSVSNGTLIASPLSVSGRPDKLLHDFFCSCHAVQVVTP